MPETIEAIFNELKKVASNIEISLTEYLKTEEAKGYISFTETKDDEHLFKVGSRRFLLRAALIPQTKYISYKTFELTREGANYPNWLCIPINDLDIMVYIDGSAFLLKDGITVTGKMHNFNKEYLQQLSSYIDITQPRPPKTL